jgi:hypothetical protein
MSYAPDGSKPFAMDETTLQLLAAKNPIACAVTFDHLVQNVGVNLIGLSNDRLKDTPVDERDSGSFRTPSVIIGPYTMPVASVTVIHDNTVVRGIHRARE